MMDEGIDNLYTLRFLVSTYQQTDEYQTKLAGDYNSHVDENEKESV